MFALASNCSHTMHYSMLLVLVVCSQSVHCAYSLLHWRNSCSLDPCRVPTLWALTQRGIGEGFAAGTFDEQSVAAVSFRALACYQATQGLICTLAFFDATTRRFACITTVVWGVATFYFLVMAYPKQYIDFNSEKDVVTISLYPDRFIQDFCEDMIFIGLLTVANVVALYQSVPGAPAAQPACGVKTD